MSRLGIIVQSLCPDELMKDRGLLPSSGKVDLVIESLELQMRRDPASWLVVFSLPKDSQRVKKC